MGLWLETKTLYIARVLGAAMVWEGELPVQASSCMVGEIVFLLQEQEGRRE